MSRDWREAAGALIATTMLVSAGMSIAGVALIAGASPAAGATTASGSPTHNTASLEAGGNPSVSFTSVANETLDAGENTTSNTTDTTNAPNTTNTTVSSGETTTDDPTNTTGDTNSTGDKNATNATDTSWGNTIESRNDSVRLLEVTATTGSEAVDSAEGTTHEVVATADSLHNSLPGSGSRLGEDGELVELLLIEAQPPEPDTLTVTSSQTPSAGDTLPYREGEATVLEDASRADRSTVITGPQSRGDVGGGPDGVAGASALGFGAILVGAVLRQVSGVPHVAQGLTTRLGRVAGRWLRFLPPFRYSQYDGSDPLEHEDRATVAEEIEQSAGVHLTELSEQIDLSLSTMRHHLRVLQREDIVAGVLVRGRRRLYPAHHDAVELDAALNDDATATVVDTLFELGATSVSDLAEEIGKDASTVTYHLQRLEADGLVVRERDGRTILNRLAPEARDALTPEVESDARPTKIEAGSSVGAD